MKYLQKTLILLIGTTFVCSCAKENIEISNEVTHEVTDIADYKNIEVGSMQASLNGDLFSCDNIYVSNQQADITLITGTGHSDGLTIALNSRSEGLYTLGGDEVNHLTYTSVVYHESGSVETMYTTQQKYNAIGTIEVLETNLENNTISGIFNGSLVLDEDDNIRLDIENGFFNQLPF